MDPLSSAASASKLARVVAVSSHRKLEGLQTAEARRKPVNRIVGTGQRAVSTGADGLESKGDVGLLAGADLKELPFAVLRAAAAAVEVDDHCGIDQVAMLLEKEGGPIRVAAGLFVGGEGDDDIVVRDEFLPLQSDQGFDQRGVAVLHVDGAAAVEPPVLLRQFEWIDRPVLRLRFHHIQVTQKQDGILRLSAVVANHDIALGGMIRRRQENHVARGEACAQQPALNGLCGLRGAMRMRGVDLHQTLQHVAGELLISRRRQRGCRGCPDGCHGGHGQAQDHQPSSH